jgi:hypothetical protein
VENEIGTKSSRPDWRAAALNAENRRLQHELEAAFDADRLSRDNEAAADAA